MALHPIWKIMYVFLLGFIRFYFFICENIKELREGLVKDELNLDILTVVKITIISRLILTT